VKKPFIERAPDYEKSESLWRSGELFGYFGDWLIEYCAENIWDCNSSGV
jgi:tellurite methyltransferase